MKEQEIDLFAQSVIETQQRLLNNNYVDMNVQDITNIYRNLYK